MRDRQKEDEDETRQTAQEVRSTDGGGGRSDFPDGRGRLVAAAAATDGAAIFCRQEVNVQNSGEAKRETASSALRPPPHRPTSDFRTGDHSPDTNSSSVRERETTETGDRVPEEVV